jgi:hypothetical protein
LLFYSFVFNIYGKKPKFQNGAQNWKKNYKNAEEGTEHRDEPKQILMPTLGRTTKRELKNDHA